MSKPEIILVEPMMPAIDKNDAALIQSAAVAMPLAMAGTPRPAT